MKLGKYLKDKFISIFILLLAYFVIILMLLVFNSDVSLIIAISFVLFSGIIPAYLLDYFKKKKFYDLLLKNIARLDKKYLVLETLEIPNFYEGQIFYQSFYDINKSMIENVKNYELSVNDFKEYVEMWIHEVKIPISSLILIAHNHKDMIDKKVLDQIKRIENYVEQVLYYVRSENAEKDYLIKKNNLSKIISSVALKNKDALLESKIDFNVNDVDYEVLTDSKWLEFILNQIINNSIKYKKENNDSYIKIFAKKQNNSIILTIYDNGIGIKEEDLSRVFDKSFTGHNGREKIKSTGMGLYIAKKLCKKLGHSIDIDSKENEYTSINIVFSENDFYNVIK